MRKKFTMLFAALTLVLGSAWAQPEEGKMYRLKDNTRNEYLTIRGYNETNNRAFGSVPVVEKEQGNIDQVWCFEEASDSKYYLKSKSGYYLVCRNWCIDACNDGSKSAIGLESATGGYYLKNGEKYFKVEDISGDNNTSHPFCDAPANHANNVTWTLEEVDANEFANFVKVIYEFKYDNVVKFTQTTEVESGADYPDYTVVLPDFVSAEEKPTGKVTVNETVNIALTVAELPFTTSMVENGELKNTVWHKVYMGKGSKSWCYNSEANNIDVTNKPQDGDYTSAYMFAFVGDVFNGFKIYNKYLGASKVLWQPTGDVNDSGVAITMANASDAIGGNWILENNQTADDVKYYVFRRDEVNQAYMNPRGNKLSYWLYSLGKTDDNATISFEKVSNEELVALVKVDFDAIFAKASDIYASKGTGVGQYTVPANFANVYAAAVAISEQETPNAAEMEDATAALKTAVEAATLNLPEEGKFYVIQSAATDEYCKEALIYAEDDNRAYWSKDYTTDSYPVSAVWQFEYVDGVCCLKNVHTAEYFNNGAAYTAFLLSENKGNVELVALGDAQFNIKTKGNVLHAQQAQNKVVPYSDGKNTPSAWYVKEVESTSINYTLTVGAAGWASLVLGFNVAIPEDENIKVYTVSSTANGYANLSEVKGVLPANTPVLIEAPEGNFDFVYSDDEPTTVGDNLLQGKPYNTYVAETAYVLAKKNDVVGLYKAKKNKDENGAEGDTHFLNNANKAYLVVEGANAPMFSFNRGEGTTSIEDVELINDNVVIYDITGRRVEKMEKGIYIVNGKKVLVK